MPPNETQLDFLENTPLHLSILESNTQLALSLLAHDKELAQEESDINKQALSNTPLLLALKTGNMEIVKEILTHPYVNINISDNTGMKVIHWAAFLRANEIINLLLHFEIEPALGPLQSLNECVASSFPSLKPEDFYVIDLQTKKYLIYQEIDEKSPLILTLPTPFTFLSGVNYFNLFQATDKITRGKKALIHVPIKNIAFHLDALLYNYFNLDKDNELGLISSFDEAHIGTKQIFTHNFSVGYDVFVEARNKLPVVSEIVTSLARVSSNVEIKSHSSSGFSQFKNE